MPAPDNFSNKSEHEPPLPTLSKPPSMNDRLYVKRDGSIATRLAVPCLIAIAIVLTALFYPQFLNWEKWKSYIDLSANNSTDARQGDRKLESGSKRKIIARMGRASAGPVHAEGAEIEIQHLSVNELALGFDKAHWGMSIYDAKAIWPLEETAAPAIPELPGPNVHPIHDEDVLSLNHYVYAGCIFSVKLNFEDKKLISIQMEADGSENFKSCHDRVLAALTGQYGREPVAASPLAPYRGYSLHGEWIWPLIDVVYNELQNAVIEIIFSKRGQSE